MNPIPTLTDQQQVLLKLLVRYEREKKLYKPLIPWPTGEPNRYVLHIRKERSLHLNGLRDFEALCAAEFLEFRWDRTGLNKLYTLTKAAHKAVENNLFGDRPADADTYDWMSIVHAMSGGTLVNDESLRELDEAITEVGPDHYQRKVDVLIGRILSIIPHLPNESRKPFASSAETLRQQIKSSHSHTSRLQQLTRELSGMGTIYIPYQLIPRIWPFLYPLILDIAERTNHQA